MLLTNLQHTAQCSKLNTVKFQYSALSIAGDHEASTVSLGQGKNENDVIALLETLAS
jgi:hypothetical protein